jgi:hypothetical protein
VIQHEREGFRRWIVIQREQGARARGFSAGL